jgi:succinate-semialdehyde dehydrogenase/glutarate-semialdehyde dehydrogenase
MSEILEPDLFTHFIDGTAVKPSGSDVLVLTDPSTGERLGELPVGTADEVDTAVASAARAAADWAGTSPAERAQILTAAGERALTVVDRLAELQSREMGQPWSVSRPITEAVLYCFAAAAAEALEYPFEKTLADSGEALGKTIQLRQPFGVAALITPWNFPLAVALSPLANLLATGHTVVWKPSERSPLSARLLAGVLDLPPGVLNLVQGDGRAGAPLSGHKDIGITVFTGSEPTGLRVAEESARHLRPAMLELGGKDPVVIDADVDPVWAAQSVSVGAFSNTGQICTSMERVYVHRDIAEPFIDALVEAAKAQVVGPAMDPTTEIGPMVDERQRAIVVQHVEDAVAKGARVLAGGAPLDGPGVFFPPTVLVDVDSSMLVMTEETFGPVAPVMVVDSFEEGLERAKDTRFGLAANILTNNPEHAARGAELPAALCWVNQWRGGAAGMQYEPARASGTGAVGSFDSLTRPSVLHIAPAQPAT